MARTLVSQKEPQRIEPSKKNEDSNSEIQTSILSPREIEQKLKMVVAARSSPEGAIGVRLGKKCLIHKHCGIPMLQVKVFYFLRSYKNLRKPPKKLPDEHVCQNPNCFYHTTLKSVLFNFF